MYIGIIVRNDGALKAGKKLYISVCGLCVARDMPPQKEGNVPVEPSPRRPNGPFSP